MDPMGSVSEMFPRFACEETALENDILMEEAIQLLKTDSYSAFIKWIEETKAYYIVDSSGNTLLHWAASLGNLPAVEALLMMKVCPKARNAMGATALLCAAASSGNPWEILETLIHNGGSDPNEKNYRGETMQTFLEQRNLSNGHGTHGVCHGLDVEFRDKQTLGTSAVLGPPAYYQHQVHDNDEGYPTSAVITEQVEVEVQDDGGMTITVMDEVSDWHPKEEPHHPSRYDEGSLSTSYEVSTPEVKDRRNTQPWYLPPYSGKSPHGGQGIGASPSPLARSPCNRGISPVDSSKAPQEKSCPPGPQISLRSGPPSSTHQLQKNPLFCEGSSETSLTQSPISHREPPRAGSVNRAPAVAHVEPQSSQQLYGANPVVSSVSGIMQEPSRGPSTSLSPKVSQWELQRSSASQSSPSHLGSRQLSNQESPRAPSVNAGPESYKVESQRSHLLEPSQSHLGSHPDMVPQSPRIASLRQCPTGCNAAIQRALLSHPSSHTESTTILPHNSSSGVLLKESSEKVGHSKENTVTGLIQTATQGARVQGPPQVSEEQSERSRILQASSMQLGSLVGEIRESPRPYSTQDEPHSYNIELKRSQQLQSTQRPLNSVSGWMQEPSIAGSTQLLYQSPQNETSKSGDADRLRKVDPVAMAPGKPTPSSKFLEKIKWNQINPYAPLPSYPAKNNGKESPPTLRMLLKEQAKMFEKYPLPPLTRTRKPQDGVSENRSRHSTAAYTPLPTSVATRTRAAAFKGKRVPPLPPAALRRIPAMNRNNTNNANTSPAPLTSANHSGQNSSLPLLNGPKVAEECTGTVVINNAENGERLATPFKELQKTLIACANYLACHPPEGTDTTAAEYTTTLTAHVTSTTTTTTTTVIEDGNDHSSSTTATRVPAERGMTTTYPIGGQKSSTPSENPMPSKKSPPGVPVPGGTTSPAPRDDMKRQVAPSCPSSGPKTSSMPEESSCSYRDELPPKEKSHSKPPLTCVSTEPIAPVSPPQTLHAADLVNKGSNSCSIASKSISNSTSSRSSLSPHSKSVSKSSLSASSSKGTSLSKCSNSTSICKAQELGGGTSGSTSSKYGSYSGVSSGSSSAVKPAVMHDIPLTANKSSGTSSSELLSLPNSKGMQFPSPSASRPNSTQPAPCLTSPSFQPSSSGSGTPSLSFPSKKSPSGNVLEKEGIPFPKPTNSSSSSVVLNSGLPAVSGSSGSEGKKGDRLGGELQVTSSSSIKGSINPCGASSNLPPPSDLDGPPERRETRFLPPIASQSSSDGNVSSGDMIGCSMVAHDNGSRSNVVMPSNSNIGSVNRSEKSTPFAGERNQKSLLPRVKAPLPISSLFSQLNVSQKGKSTPSSDKKALPSMPSMGSQKGVGGSFAQIPGSQKLPSAFTVEETHTPHAAVQKESPPQVGKPESPRFPEVAALALEEASSVESSSSPNVLIIPLLNRRGNHHHLSGEHCAIPARILHMFVDEEGGYVPKNLRPEYLHGRRIILQDQKPQKSKTSFNLKFECEHTIE